MTQSKRDYSKEIAILCKQHNLNISDCAAYLITRKTSASKSRKYIFRWSFFPIEPKEYGRCYFGLGRDFENLFGREVILFDLDDKMPPDFLERIKRNKTDIYKA